MNIFLDINGAHSLLQSVNRHAEDIILPMDLDDESKQHVLISLQATQAMLAEVIDTFVSAGSWPLSYAPRRPGKEKSPPQRTTRPAPAPAAPVPTDSAHPWR